MSPRDAAPPGVLNGPQARLATRSTTRIRPSAPIFPLGYREVWNNRDLVWLLAVRDFKLRYRQTALGAAWIVIGPLLGAGVFTLVFGKIGHLPSDGVPYFPFVLSGLLGWNMFQGTFSRCSSCLVDNTALIGKVYFPRLSLPVASLTPGLVDMAIATPVAVAAVLGAGRRGIGPLALLAPLFVIAVGALAVGAGLIAAALMVSYRDIRYGIPIVLQAAMFATPVLYPASAVPPSVRGILGLNPLIPLLEGTRWSLLGTTAPSPMAVLYSAAWVVATVTVGTVAFRRMERRFADVI